MPVIVPRENEKMSLTVTTYVKIKTLKNDQTTQNYRVKGTTHAVTSDMLFDASPCFNV